LGETLYIALPYNFRIFVG